MGGSLFDQALKIGRKACDFSGVRAVEICVGGGEGVELGRKLIVASLERRDVLERGVECR